MGEETPKIERKKITEFMPDQANANAGTQRGMRMLDDSIEEVGLGRSVVADRHGNIIGGNKTQEIAVQRGLEDVIVVHTTGNELVVVQRDDLDLYEDDPNNRARRMAYWDNLVADRNMLLDPEQLQLDYDAGFDFGKMFYDKELLALLPAETPNGSESDGGSGEARKTLSERFIIPPFSVLDARQGYWQARKRAWIALGIRGAEGRGENSAPGGSPMPSTVLTEDGTTQRGDSTAAPVKKVKGKQAANIGGSPMPLDRPQKLKDKDRGRTFGQDLMRGEHVVGGDKTRAIQTQDWVAQVKGEDFSGLAGNQSGTSIFDPVLCELVYRWFTPNGGHILDPFAGEATKGVVATYLGYQYTGVELRPEQVDANVRQAFDIGVKPNWICGDSEKLGTLLNPEIYYDLIFTSPPYYDLEIYSESEKDGSAFETYEKFMRWYADIFAQAVKQLNDNRFLVVKVGEIRDKAGAYRNFVGDNIRTFLDLGLNYYNEAILVTVAGSLPIRVGKQFSGARKLGKTHQNILVFYKGDVRKVKDHFPQEIEYANLDVPGEDA